MQAAYDLRSRIVHGDDIREKDRKLGDQVVDLDVWTYFCAEIVRQAVLWCFNNTQPGTKVSLTWPDYYFGACPV